MSVAPHEVILQGYLHKRSRHLHVWKIRYCLLTKNALLYSSKSGKKTKFLIGMSDAQVITDQNSVLHKGNYVMELRCGKKKFFLSASTERDRDLWASTISAQAMTVDDPTGGVPENGSHVSESFLGSITLPILKTTSRYLGLKKTTSKTRREERKRQKLPKMKKSLREVWIEDILPPGNEKPDSQFVEALCFAGIPKEVRGRAWAWLLGNKLQINEELFGICRSRAQAVRKEMSLRKNIQNINATVAKPQDKDKEKLDDGVGELVPAPESQSEKKSTEENEMKSDEETDLDSEFSHELLEDVVSIAEKLVAQGERSIRLVNIDMPRTFGHHPLFREGAAGAEKTREVLEAYICYRPDLGYVQGMSYLAAALCFHMDSFTAFKAMVSLMSTSLLFDMFRLEEKRTKHYISVYDQIFAYELPRLHAHFRELGMDAQMYAVDWALTLFTRCVPLNLAFRLWDCYVLLGTAFFFQASMGILLLFEESLLAMEVDEIMRFLHDIPKSTASNDLFEAIESVALSREEINELLAGGTLRPWSPDSTRQIGVEYPDTYE